MKMTEKMLEKMGVTSPVVRKNLLGIFEEMEGRIAEMEEELEGKDGELAENRKLAAVEKEILAAGGRNVKTILALVDLEKVGFDQKKGLTGLDLESVKAEAPYLFHEKEEKRKGTGVTRGYTKKDNEITAAFRRGLRR